MGQVTHGQNWGPLREDGSTPEMLTGAAAERAAAVHAEGEGLE